MDVCKTAGMGLPLPVQIPTDSESWSIERIAMVGTVTMLLSVHSEAPWDSGPVCIVARAKIKNGKAKRARRSHARSGGEERDRGRLQRHNWEAAMREKLMNFAGSAALFVQAATRLLRRAASRGSASCGVQSRCAALTAHSHASACNCRQHAAER